MGDDEGLLAVLARLGGTPKVLRDNPELCALVLPALRNDYRLIERYEPRSTQLLKCPISAWIGDEDSEVTVEEARGWAAYTLAAFDLRVFVGNHFYLISRGGELMEEFSMLSGPLAN
jgi:pyochelin biosynthetic protein PchC